MAAPSGFKVGSFLMDALAASPVIAPIITLCGLITLVSIKSVKSNY